MNIDFGTAITGFIILIISSTPFAIMYFNGVKKKNKSIKSLCDFAQLNGCEIRQFEFCNDLVIGIDIDKKMLFFFCVTNKKTVTQIVDISIIQYCYVNKKTSMIKYDLVERELVEAVELVFVPMDMNQQEVTLELFHIDYKAQLSGELQFAQVWEEKINTFIKKN